MAVRGTLIGEFTVLLTGLDLRALTFPEWQRNVGVMARNLQNRVARSFAAQKTAGRSSLIANSPEYTARKIKQGLDPRRGHRTNMLQTALSTAKLTMVTLTMQGPNEAAARIIMEEQVLHAMVPHSVYYEEMKVRTAGILSLAASWVREESNKLRARELAGEARRVRIDRTAMMKNAKFGQAIAGLERITKQQKAMEVALAKAEKIRQRNAAPISTAGSGKAYNEILKSGKYGQFKKALEAAERMIRR